MTRKETRPGEGLQVIHVALFRMGTMSISEAYRTLGYKVHHGLDDNLRNPYGLLEQAAEATWPSVPNARPRERFTRKDWDQIWGLEYDISTDLSSPFADQLIEVYPEAKVVIVQRPFEHWWPSMKSRVLDTLLTPTQWMLISTISFITGIRAGPAMVKIHYGFFGAKTLQEIEANARATYDNYYQKIRNMVPPERRLEYSMEDGWGPLCIFLGKEVPDMPFPRSNDRKHHEGNTSRTFYKLAGKYSIKLGPWLLASAVLLFSVCYMTK